MSYLKERILKDGKVLPNNVIKVDSFMNHQIDPQIMQEIGIDFYYRFRQAGITKVLTIEASGIAPAIITAAHFKVPMLFAKKTQPSTLKNQERYETDVHSYTKNVTSRVIISKQYLNENDRVLIIDDFLANGEAALGLIDLVEQAGATVVGVGICIEKSFQAGRQKLEAKGVPVHSICRISSLENQQIQFLESN
ncbi:xanthine phosphoribosyltransferase [Aerococcaceae bacterium zg-ZJ1578]|uniref:xanthine phosphoribosyltransferase n=1 Tax=Aerococcaceae TaxID=186827 RepID=UPI0013BC37BD|nr:MULTISPECIES: xanthine phosphoribosyltransferase [unclassified Facklamia]MBK0347462.1 xanthine phosphoribosyltransferase [Aerococcaceae bacterium zg-1578]MBR7927690.1 xanthine phosphoribosyltransferase [Aerococcaceae bacterium zg-ZUI334]MBS4462029.1 xanthine phosphoribosyltransferase [Aerococcaceae bacterium zg-B36]QQD65679.1 xanthine phosphoribosyltransferase [Aerococcaceae bacterium zg-252]NEW64492.1 xanthine phosphoribosyltransferase [Facklamia sp. 252]